MARGKPKSDLYMPKPTEWKWDSLSDFDVRNRLQAARDTRARLEAEMERLREEREAARRDLWARLPKAKLYEQQTKLARLEDMGKQLVQLGKLLGQVTTAIEYIERRASMEATA